MSLENHDHTDGRESVERTGERRAPEPPRMADREVPLGRRATPPAVHAWLDGEVPETAVKFGDTSRDVEFWKRMNVEVDRRRAMRTPPYVYEQIMASLPHSVPGVTSPWWRRTMKLTPVTAIALGAGLLAAGIVVSLLLLRAL